MRSRSNGGVIGAYQLPTQNYANGVFFIHDAAIYNTGNNPIWPLGTGFIYSATGGTINTAADNTNYKTHTFTANGTFSVVTGSAYIDILLVGGGGSSGSTTTSSTQYGGSGGGGGGTVILASNIFVASGTTFTVEVGRGGSSVNAGAYQGVNGSPSRVTATGYSLIAKGGGGGAAGTTVSATGSQGGSGGGGNFYTNSTIGFSGSAGTIDSMTLGPISGGIITSYQNSGGSGYTALNYSYPVSGGGGGAGQPGFSGYHTFDPTKSGWGGDGWKWDRTGFYYGAGGTGGGNFQYNGYTGLYGNSIRSLSSTNPAANGWGLGGNGKGFGGSPSTGNNGGSGTVIFCYRYQ